MELPVCSRCGIQRARLHRHHIVPRSRGGGNEATNIALLCPNCHDDIHAEMRVATRQAASTDDGYLTRRLEFRLTLDEKVEIARKASAMGLNVSEFVRLAALP